MTPPSLQEPCPPVNWLELPADVSASIIRRLSVVDILTSVQYVCPRWRRICRDPSMWRSIDVVEHSARTNVQLDVSKVYRLAVDLSSGGLLYLNLEFYNFSYGLLLYVADRSKHLQRIRLGYFCLALSKVEFFEAVEKLPVLEELDVSESDMCCYFSSESIATISRLCPLLHSFTFGVVSDDLALAIGKNMCGLRQLQISGRWADNNGLLAILDGCRHLESLDLRGCYIKLEESLKKRCSEQIQDFHGPEDYNVDFHGPEDYDVDFHGPQDYDVDFLFNEEYGDESDFQMCFSD